MAKGFFILKNDVEFFTRWTGYDRIIEIAIRELSSLENSETIINTLRSKIPAEGEQKGDAVFYNSKGEMVQRILDLSIFNESDYELFWEALKTGSTKLKEQGTDYSTLNPERLEQLLELRE